MKILFPIFSVRLRALAAVAVFAGLVAGVAANTVGNPVKRTETLEKAKELLAERTPALSPKNPFNPEGFGESENTDVAVVTPVGPRSTRELLQQIGASLKPSGFFVLGGEPTLVFGQKRVKAGGLLTITFEGNEYTVEIVSIDRPNFTLRLNREEFTRPIK
jgi:hypothetical protein